MLERLHLERVSSMKGCMREGFIIEGFDL